MKITFNPDLKLFRLACGEMEYGFAVNNDGQLMNLHWGAPMLSDGDYSLLLSDRAVMANGSRDCNSGEYRFGAPFDYAAPAIRVRFPDGAETLRLVYKSHEITGDSLTVTLADSFYPLKVRLVYKTFADLPLISRSAVITNNCSGEVILRSAMSATVQLPRGAEWRLTHYAGEWGAEYERQQSRLGQGRIVLETSYLTDAAAHIVPFFALDEEGRSTETDGEVYFGALQYSGDFKIVVESQHTQLLKRASVTAGVNDFTSEISLASGESFETPSLIVGFSNSGFGHMSEILYDWQFDHILPRGKKTDKAHAVRPVIYNTWYPYEFDIDEKKLIDFIPKAKYIGAELYVIDDGWMKGRSNDKRGLGDWFIDEERFPHGLRYISDKAHEAGMMFGIWVEPEMVNPDSDLYRAHPDWVLSEPNRERSLMRTQLILDMSRDDITDWAIDWLDRLIEDANLDYLKWDMNREASEIGLYQLERGKAVKYMKNIERIWKHLNEKFPDLLLENCA
ncbi:MAG: alpha-galactosidase, partial [Candidatus Flemingiibacterium sp.]